MLTLKGTVSGDLVSIETQLWSSGGWRVHVLASTRRWQWSPSRSPSSRASPISRAVHRTPASSWRLSGIVWNLDPLALSYRYLVLKFLLTLCWSSLRRTASFAKKLLAFPAFIEARGI